LALALLPIACSLRRTPPPGADGPTIYDYQNCANCHGAGRAGSSRGPALAGLARHWTRERLVLYLADPQGLIAGDERLHALSGQYSSEMGPYDNLTPEQRAVLAEWLLSE
jgi:mono/diheme cytochrome c family protein